MNTSILPTNDNDAADRAIDDRELLRIARCRSCDGDGLAVALDGQAVRCQHRGVR